MKKIVLALAVMLLASVSASAEMRVLTVFNAQSTAASGTSSSSAIDLARFQSLGSFSLQVAVSGTGTAKFEYLVSNDGVNYLEPTGASDIATGITATSGPGADGRDIYYFEPKMARYLKLRVTETGGANAVVVTAYLAIQ